MRTWCESLQFFTDFALRQQRFSWMANQEGVNSLLRDVGAILQPIQPQVAWHLLDEHVLITWVRREQQTNRNKFTWEETERTKVKWLPGWAVNACGYCESRWLAFIAFVSESHPRWCLGQLSLGSVWNSGRWHIHTLSPSHMRVTNWSLVSAFQTPKLGQITSFIFTPPSLSQTLSQNFCRKWNWEKGSKTEGTLALCMVLALFQNHVLIPKTPVHDWLPGWCCCREALTSWNAWTSFSGDWNTGKFNSAWKLTM